MSFDEIVKEYENLSDTQLADEFTLINAYVDMVWENVSNETSDRWDVLSQMIQERFVAKFATSIIIMYKDPKMV
jgi:hypothetical protein